MRIPVLFKSIYSLFILVLISSYSHGQSKTSRFESEIVAFEKADQKNNPGDKINLFVGSSSIRMWQSLNEDFPNVNVLNRGFGGSETSDAILYFDRIVKPYRPQKIFLYEGDNDIANGKSVDTVFNDFQQFVSLVEENLPDAQVYFIAIKPSPSRWSIHLEMELANQMIKEICNQKKNLQFIDVYTPMIGMNGKPTPELFVSDSLHMTRKGYEIWTQVIFPFVNEATKGQE